MKARDDLTTPSSLRAKRNATISCQDGATAVPGRSSVFRTVISTRVFLNRFHFGGEWNNLVPFKPLHFDLDHPILLAYYVYIRVFSDPERIFSDLKAPPPTF